MKNMKKFMALILAATMTVTMVPATAFAATTVTLGSSGQELDQTKLEEKQKTEVAAKAIAKSIEGSTFTTEVGTAGDAQDAFIKNLKGWANDAGYSLENPAVTVDDPTVGINPDDGSSILPTIKVTGVLSNGEVAELDEADRTINITVNVTAVTDAEKAVLVAETAARAINRCTTFTNDSTTKDLEKVVNDGLAANKETADAKVAKGGIDKFHVEPYGSHEGEDGFINADVTVEFKSTDGKTVKTVTFSLISGKDGNNAIPIRDDRTPIKGTDLEGNAIAGRTKNEQYAAVDSAYARVPYQDFTIEELNSKVSDFLKSKTYYEEDFYENLPQFDPNLKATTLKKQIIDDLTKPGSPLYLDNKVSLEKVQYTTTPATHDADGSIKVMVTVAENKGNKSGATPKSGDYNQLRETYSVTLALHHSPLKTKAEVTTATQEVQDALKLDASSIQTYDSTTAATEDSVKEAITKAIKAKIAQAPKGFTKPLANDLDANAPFEVEIVNFVAPAFNKEGKVEYKVTYSLPKEDGYKTRTFEVGSFTLTLPKLKAVYSDGIAIDDITIRKGVTKKIAVKFSSADVTDKLVAIDFDGDPLKQANDIVDLKHGDVSYTPSYIDGKKTITLNGKKYSLGDGFSDRWAVVAKKCGTTVLRAVYINEKTQKAYTTTFKVTVIPGFTDVANRNLYYYGPVYDLNEMGVVAGVSDTAFAPKKSVTRAQFVTFLWRLDNYRNHKDHVATTGTSKFTDVASDAYYAAAVEWAVKNGVTSGRSATKFAPNATVTRAEAVKFLYNYAGAESVYNATTNFTDVKDGKFYTEAVAWAAAKGITSGKSASVFAPSDDVTRAEAVTFIYKTADLMNCVDHM